MEALEDFVRGLRLPSLTHDQIQTLLQEMKKEGRIFSGGKTRGTRWYPGTENNTR